MFLKTRKKVSEWRSKQTDKKNVTGYKEVRNHPKDKIIKDKIIKDNIPESKNSGLFNPFKNLFLEYYERLSENQYYWSAKDGKKIHTLINQVNHAGLTDKNLRFQYHESTLRLINTHALF